jgi:hypothetical protein
MPPTTFRLVIIQGTEGGTLGTRPPHIALMIEIDVDLTGLQFQLHPLYIPRGFNT